MISLLIPSNMRNKSKFNVQLDGDEASGSVNLIWISEVMEKHGVVAVIKEGKNGDRRM